MKESKINEIAAELRKDFSEGELKNAFVSKSRGGWWAIYDSAPPQMDMCGCLGEFKTRKEATVCLERARSAA